MQSVSTLTPSITDPLPQPVLATLAQRGAANLAASSARDTPVQGGRWHVRLRVEEDHDVWLLGWGLGAGIELHDHGDAAGALAVVHGTLVEQRIDGTKLVNDVVRAGNVRTFGLGERHGVQNRGPRAALSVHVYSPPLSTMTFFDTDGASLRQEDVDLPGLWAT